MKLIINTNSNQTATIVERLKCLNIQFKYAFKNQKLYIEFNISCPKEIKNIKDFVENRIVNLQRKFFMGDSHGTGKLLSNAKISNWVDFPNDLDDLFTGLNLNSKTNICYN